MSTFEVDCFYIDYGGGRITDSSLCDTRSSETMGVEPCAGSLVIVPSQCEPNLGGTRAQTLDRGRKSGSCTPMAHMMYNSPPLLHKNNGQRK